ncbi:hypothetical protein B1H58_16485 [Pantoea alhagi]|uniref:Uncharacterized protein n=1 Tax=Pantoea alhagi TaxID=1891675 RepID=A0A1W6B8M9_9GAMM|nr:hypothetical protein B1H58_16485 [Pantoea alhagi]
MPDPHQHSGDIFHIFFTLALSKNKMLTKFQWKILFLKLSQQQVRINPVNWPVASRFNMGHTKTE